MVFSLATASTFLGSVVGSGFLAQVFGAPSGVYRQWTEGNIDSTTIGEYQITYHAEDNSGNIGQSPTTTVFVQDVTPPYFVYESDIIFVERQNIQDSLFNWDVYLRHYLSAIDEYDSYHGISTDLTIIFPQELSTTQVGEYPIELLAIDEQTNATTSNAVKIVVRDTLFPQLIISTSTNLIIIEADEDTELPDGWYRDASNTISFPVYADQYIAVTVCDLYHNCTMKTIRVDWFGAHPPKPPSVSPPQSNEIGSILTDRNKGSYIAQELFNRIRDLTYILQLACNKIDPQILTIIRILNISIDCETDDTTTTTWSISKTLSQCPDLQYEDQHPCVYLLQEYLNANDILLAPKRTVGAPGWETNNFCRYTEFALQRFQLKHNLPITAVFDTATKQNILQIGDFYQSSMDYGVVSAQAQIIDAKCPQGENRWNADDLMK